MESLLKYPLNDNEWLKKTLIGGLLIMGSFLLVPVLFLFGYHLRVMEEGLRGNRRLPNFDQWGKMFSRGLAGVGIGIVYPLFSLPFFLIGNGLPGTPGALFQFMAIMVAILAVYLIPAGLTNYLRCGNFGAAFDTDFVLTIAWDVHYVQTWLLVLLIGFIGGFFSNLLTVVLVGFFLQFYVNVILFYLFGQGIAEITGPLN